MENSSPVLPFWDWREAVSLGSFHHVCPVLPCDETGYRSRLIKAALMYHGCTSSSEFD